jgi:hypothetical protein
MIGCFSPANPWGYLAKAVIKQAMMDWRHVEYKKGLTIFYQSFWFDDLCDLAGYNPDVIRERLGVKG